MSYLREKNCPAPNGEEESLWVEGVSWWMRDACRCESGVLPLSYHAPCNLWSAVAQRW